MFPILLSRPVFYASPTSTGPQNSKIQASSFSHLVNIWSIISTCSFHLWYLTDLWILNSLGMTTINLRSLMEFPWDDDIFVDRFLSCRCHILSHGGSCHLKIKEVQVCVPRTGLHVSFWLELLWQFRSSYLHIFERLESAVLLTLVLTSVVRRPKVPPQHPDASMLGL